MGGILEGVRVLDFGRYIAGPYCATLLAEFGADVIRVEKRDGSEDRFVAPVGEGGEGALFLQINRNKKCITLDPMKAEGQEVLRRLVERSDVVIANLPPQTLRAMKLDYELVEGDQARHHPDDGDGLRQSGPLVRARRLRWRRAGDVGRGLHDRRRATRRTALPCPGSTSARRCIAPSAR